ncbi:MAG: ORF6N domain-containing protein, partial [Elusimicrobiota bacterium]|nr:ORF6N domain-containing protein [Elusimicrobiota bacterium]
MKFRVFRNQKVLTDSDFAEAIGVPTKAFIGFLKRNKAAFSEGDILTLTREEQADLVQNYCFTQAERMRYTKRLPYILTPKAIVLALCMYPRNQAAK